MDAKRVTLMVAAAVILAACASELDRARRTKPMGDAFSRALSSGYLQLAENEEARWNLSKANRLARRSISAANGSPPAPDNGARNYRGAAKQAQLNAARIRLVETLSANARLTAPETAAQAQVAYDCWVMQSAGGNQNDLDACRTRFSTAMNQIDAGPAALGTPKQKFTIYFEFDSATITPEAQDVVDDILAELLANDYRLIRIEGHADRVGPSQYNQALSTRRAKAVNLALLSAASEAPASSFEGFGERRPAKATPDGIREILNRRTEIYLF